MLGNMCELAQALKAKASGPVLINDALNVMALLEAGLDSHHQRRWVKLKERGGLRRRLTLSS